MTYTVSFRKSALKALKSMPIETRQKMIRELELIALNPFAYRGDWKPLKGSDLWRLRVGGWRAICELQKGQLVLLVVKVGSRGDIYK